MIKIFASLTRLLKHITGHNEQPRVQQQHMQPQNSHLTFSGSVFFNTLFIRWIVALNSSGATRDTKPAGNSTLNRLLKPNLKEKFSNVMFSSTLKETLANLMILTWPLE